MTELDPRLLKSRSLMSGNFGKVLEKLVKVGNGPKFRPPPTIEEPSPKAAVDMGPPMKLLEDPKVLVVGPPIMEPAAVW